ncbi:GAF domain-containing protein [Spinactinospora alkalitolerans]|uniref:GAF domain-containing protein n=1 Tax=Spinactinospora alkalitolerans TaxID=687207 RepID=A0A852TR06_9ACTN|nr:GAF and ANTAR domain-containing protein [Spinactinospora alkalitolerans]NYE45252.1 GAF domain-containing protein [Spinactinospora alkalitolerans]
MWIERLARDIGALGQDAGSTPERALDRMSTAAARGVPGCSAALVVIWRDVRPDEEGCGEVAGRHVVVDYGASHSDLATAFEHQYMTDEGPTAEAVRGMRAVTVGDVLREDRWPRYTSMAVQCGDRSSVTFPCALEGGEVVTFGIHSGRADAFDEAVVTPLVAMLAEHAAMALQSADRYTDVAREAAHMRRAMSARAVIDQAKGILMHARGCDAKEAFEELRKVAQRNRMKVAEVARRLVEEHAESNAQGAG